MAERMPWGRRLLVAAAGAAAAGAVFAIVISPQPTRAAWTAPKTLTATVTAATPVAPTGLTCGASTGLLSGSVPFTWTAPVGSAPSGYTLSWTGAATGAASFSGTSGAVPAAALLGTLTVSVRADYGSWASAPAAQTRQTTVLLGGVLWGCS